MRENISLFDESDSCEKAFDDEKVRSKSCERWFSVSCSNQRHRIKPSPMKTKKSKLPFPPTLPSFSQPTNRNPCSYIYPTQCDRRGRCVIFSIDYFEPILCLPKRNGSEIDIQNIYKAFAKLGFEVSVYANLTAYSLLSTVRDVAKENHKTCDCFACVILSHGDEGGFIYATDKAVALDQLILPFRGDQCQDLRGKPKLFFIQACRGTALDEGALVCDGPSASTGNEQSISSLRRIPIEADFLISYAVQTGYFAFRNSLSGSWFIGALTECLIRYGHVLDLLSIMTRVNYSVAYEYESTAANPLFSGKKQMPSFVSTLTKQVIFPHKPIIRQ